MPQAATDDVVDDEAVVDEEDPAKAAPAGETPADEETDTGDEDDEQAETADELVVSIGDEAPPAQEDGFDGQPAPDWVKELRKGHKELLRKNRELEDRLKAAPAPAPAAVVVGDKPTLEGCDYDAEKFGQQLEAWHQRKLDADAAKRTKDDAEKAASAAWQTTVDNYGKAKAELQPKVKNFDDAEEALKGAFSQTQQGILLEAAESPKSAVLLVAAIGSNPKKLKELAAISNPVKFTAAVAKLETQLKVTPRKTAPLPERQVRGNAPISGTVDSQLAKLEADADRSGDRTKVAHYRRQLILKGRQQK